MVIIESVPDSIGTTVHSAKIIEDISDNLSTQTLINSNRNIRSVIIRRRYWNISGEYFLP